MNMKLNVIRGERVKGSVVYRADEYSFDTIHGEYSNADLCIRDINLGINGDMRQIVQVWGFSPQNRWKKMDCLLPPSYEGIIAVSEFEDDGLSRRLNDSGFWKEYYNPVSGWLCLDSGDFRFCTDECVCFMANALALIRDGEMLALWLKVQRLNDEESRRGRIPCFNPIDVL